MAKFDSLLSWVGECEKGNSNPNTFLSLIVYNFLKAGPRSAEAQETIASWIDTGAVVTIECEAMDKLVDGLVGDGLLKHGLLERKNELLADIRDILGDLSHKLNYPLSPIPSGRSPGDGHGSYTKEFRDRPATKRGTTKQSPPELQNLKDMVRNELKEEGNDGDGYAATAK
jgi:hypothetical protein